MEILTRAQTHKLGKVRIVGSGLNEIIYIDEAISRAEEQGLDLVLVSSDTTPPVVRIQDFKKLEYEKKKAKKANKQTSGLKEIQFKINISEHDLQTKIKKIDSFLERGDKVKISLRLKGREKDNPDRANDLVDKICQQVVCKFSKIPGPIPMAILEPSKVTVKKAK